MLCAATNVYVYLCVCVLKISRANNSVKCRESFDMPSCVCCECSFMSLQYIVAYQQAHYLVAVLAHTHIH